jgi:hypothetical protein
MAKYIQVEEMVTKAEKSNDAKPKKKKQKQPYFLRKCSSSSPGVEHGMQSCRLPLGGAAPGQGLAFLMCPDRSLMQLISMFSVVV